ncbi:hypothetical protein [Kitasatospora aureofaciens]|uniref:hypothetical protein n=1 Tax=Kitasatospora aureofaciens TaxID=1894 RepID=UPI0033D7A6D8
MAATVRGLAVEEIAEIVECLLLGAASAEQHAPLLADRRRALADALGDALGELPARAPQ